jgi:polar amino acid transport system substrate-binding protein
LRTSKSTWLLTPLAVLALAATGASSTKISFTSSQMANGQKQFAQSCAPCHGERLEGGAGPALTGPTFETLSKKVGADVGDIFTYMTTNMPLNEPASLSHDQYVSIMAFILSRNGYKAGRKPLTFAAAEKSKAPIIKKSR